MGTFAETAIVDYHLSLVNQGIQTSVFRFRLQQKKTEVCRFPFSFAATNKIAVFC
jgi:hypothetical protein